MGQLISAAGIKPDSDKVKAILELEPSCNKIERKLVKEKAKSGRQDKASEDSEFTTKTFRVVRGGNTVVEICLSSAQFLNGLCGERY